MFGFDQIARRDKRPGPRLANGSTEDHTCNSKKLSIRWAIILVMCVFEYCVGGNKVFNFVRRRLS